MKTRIRSLHFDADQKLLDYINEKVDQLYKADNQIQSVNVVLRIDKNSKNKNKTVVMEAQLTGRRLYAEDIAESFEQATGLAVDELKKQVIKYKEKLSETHI